ncbi:hypothetical protein LCGC14_1225630 [marine sediment metagenome]|uniref:Uncharacterized protein n=1 Tax=marine sediment metagenome TaxID=412755 RepID=A0A0F9NSA3_9ZZZZ
MGIVAHIYLYCNGDSDYELDCPLNGEEAWSADAGHESRYACKKNAIREGWKFCKPNRAYCPQCKAALAAKGE